MNKFILLLGFVFSYVVGFSQTTLNKIYNEDINPEIQLTEAISKASSEGKHVVVQLGGNWCKWCIRFAKFVEEDADIKQLVEDNYEFIHVNYNPRNQSADPYEVATRKMLLHLGNPVRFGFPVLVVLDKEGKVIHTQDSSLLESGDGYDKEKVERFFRMWTPEAVEKAKITNE